MSNNIEQIQSDLASKLLCGNLDCLMDNVIDLENKDLPDESIIPFIRQGQNKDVRCWALLKIKFVHEQLDAELVVQTLNENDSRIRELASEVINRHLTLYEKSYSDLFNKESYYDAYVKTVTDINPRVTRNITATYAGLNNKNLLLDKLILALQTEKGPFVSYWVLEGIGKIINFCSKDKIEQYSQFLLKLFSGIIIGQDHLLREKVALILVDLVKFLSNQQYNDIKAYISRLKNDSNFYVKEIAQNIILKEVNNGYE